jgi:hypothetical protein
MKTFKGMLSQYHSDLVIEEAEKNADGSIIGNPEMVLRYFVRNISEKHNVELDKELEKQLALTCEIYQEENKKNYMYGFIRGARTAVDKNWKAEHIEKSASKNCEFTQNRDFAFMFNFGDNDFSGYIEQAIEKYIEKYNREMQQIEVYSRFNYDIKPFIEKIWKYESFRTIKEMLKTLYKQSVINYKCDSMTCNDNYDTLTLHEMLNKAEKDILYLEFDNPNSYIFGTNADIDKILEDGYKYDEDKPIEETYYWNNSESVVVRVKDGRMSYTII